MGNKRLYRTQGADAMVGGVCGGIAEYFNLDPTLVRVLWVLLIFCGSLGIWPYIICLIIMPKKHDIRF